MIQRTLNEVSNGNVKRGSVFLTPLTGDQIFASHVEVSTQRRNYKSYPDFRQ